MGRSTKKGPYVDEKLAKKIEQLNVSKKKRSSRPGLSINDHAGIRRPHTGDS